MSYYSLSFEEEKIFEAIDEDFEKFIKQVHIYNSSVESNQIDVKKLRTSWQVAKYWHKDTRRKSGELYLYHPLSVCKKIFNDGLMETDVLIAALLHDTVEDTPYTFEELNEDFGNGACDLVKAVTKFEKTEDPTDGITKKQAQIKTDEHLLEVAKDCPLAAYIKFADRWHNLHTAQKMSEESIKYNINHTRAFLIPVARKLGCNRIAEELMDACLLAQNPEGHENIYKIQKSFVNSSRKTILKTHTAIKQSCKDAVEMSNGDGRIDSPLPYMIAAEINSKYKNVNLHREDLFSFYSYKPYTILYFKVLKSTQTSLKKDFLHLCKNLIENETITVISKFRTYNQDGSNICYVDITDAYNNKIKVIIYKEDFLNTIFEHHGINLTPVAILPPEKKIYVYTREGNRMEIEKGCTVLDFAFVLNLEIGVCFAGAKVNDKQVEMDYVLEQGDQVTIVKSGVYTARLDWFKILETKQATSRLVEWMKENQCKE